MTATNDFLPFCSTNTGSNLLSQADYASDAQLPIGNQPGVARAVLVNKALRQATYIASCLSQYLANKTGNNVLDDATPSEVITTLGTAIDKLPNIQAFLSGSGNYTVSTPAPNYLRVRMVGGGGGGGGIGTPPTAAGDGGSSTFGTSLLVANGGTAGGGGSNSGTGAPGDGGTVSISSPAISILALQGARGSGGSNQVTSTESGGAGGGSVFGGAGGGAIGAGGGYDAKANTGSGGGGAGSAIGATCSGSGGAAGGYLEAIIPNPTAGALYAYTVGAAGAPGLNNGGNGAAGQILVEAFY